VEDGEWVRVGGVVGLLSGTVFRILSGTGFRFVMMAESGRPVMPSRVDSSLMWRNFVR